MYQTNLSRVDDSEFDMVQAIVMRVFEPDVDT